MKKFEYKIIGAPRNIDACDLVKTLNSLGSEGWELCTDVGLTFIFKRELKP